MIVPLWCFSSTRSCSVTQQSEPNNTSQPPRCNTGGPNTTLDPTYRGSRSFQRTTSKYVEKFFIDHLLTLLSTRLKTTPYQNLNADSHWNDSTKHTDQPSLYTIVIRRGQNLFHGSNSTSHPFQAIKKPPACRFPIPPSLTTLIVYVTLVFLLLSSTAIAAPAHAKPSNLHLIHNRQAVPDRTGQTGNGPASIDPEIPRLSVSPSPTPCVIFPIPTAATPSPSPPSSTPSIPSPGNEGNTNGPPGQLGLNPNPPIRPLVLTSSPFPLTPARIAGIAVGGLALLCIIIAVAVWMWKRRRVDVNEIPIRRSKLVSRLGFRVFGEKTTSRSVSRNERRDSRGSVGSNGSKKSWLDKGTIGRPKAEWVENGFLSVPKAAFVGRDEFEERAPWVDGFKGSIGRPRPSRPRSAEPLGRLSGMGLGMGYLK